MSLIKELFKNLTNSLVENHHYASSIYFTTDLEKYDFVNSKYLNLDGIKVNEPIAPVKCISQCIKEKRPVVDVIAQKTYGLNLKVWVWPIIEDEKVVGAYGYMFPRCDAVIEILDDVAQSAIESLTENAFASIIKKKRPEKTKRREEKGPINNH
ncbi:MAG: hypothetical protein HPY50_10835 [Firmicutes bacterium]|nr:hypothetical protein [Bacillota bacterium]